MHPSTPVLWKIRDHDHAFGVVHKNNMDEVTHSQRWLSDKHCCKIAWTGGNNWIH